MNQEANVFGILYKVEGSITFTCSIAETCVSDPLEPSELFSCSSKHGIFVFIGVKSLLLFQARQNYPLS